MPDRGQRGTPFGQQHLAGVGERDTATRPLEAERRTRRAALAAEGRTGIVLATKSGSSSELLAKLLDAFAASQTLSRSR